MSDPNIFAKNRTNAMKKKIIIETLSPSQTALLAQWRDEWTRIGLSTEPANRPEAERAVIMAYAAAGLPAPRIVWCQSPLSQGLTRAIVMNMRDSVADSVRDSVAASVRASVWASVWASVRASVRDSVADSVGASVAASVRASVWASVRDSVRASVRDSVWASVRASVRDSVADSVRDSVRDSVGASVRDSGYGQHDASWLAFYDYFRHACGLSEQTRLAEGLTLLARHAGWFLPHEKICWVSERPSILHRDDEGRLHCENGAALGYPDKFSIWAWHGVRVPQQVIERPETLTPKQIQDETNSEARRVMLERFGAERFIREAGGTVLHEADLHGKFPEYVNLGDRREFVGYTEGSEHVRLIRTSLLRADEKPLTFVHVVCPSTAREYYLRVDPRHTDAIEAVASTFNMTGLEYRSLVQAHS